MPISPLSQSSFLYRIAAARTSETQEKDTGLSTGQMLGVGGAALLGGLGGYKYLRRFRPSDNASLRGLQEQLKDRGVDVVTHQPVTGMAKRVREGLYGAQDLSQAAVDAARAGTSVKTERGLLHHSAQANLPISGHVDINKPGGAAQYFDDKKLFADLMQANAPAGSVPKTRHLPELHQRDWERTRQALNEEFGENNWLLKPREGSLGNVKDFPTAEFPGEHREVQNAMKYPQAFIAQEKIPIQSEYRVHTVNGVPVTATHRRAPEGGFRDWWNRTSERLGLGNGGFAHVPVRGDERDALYKFVNDVHAPFHASPEFYAENPLHIAYDVARLPDGTFRLIEGNPTPGTLNNPMISRAVTQAMTGRKAQDVAALQAAGIGAGAGLASYGGMKAYNHTQSAE